MPAQRQEAWKDKQDSSNRGEIIKQWTRETYGFQTYGSLFLCKVTRSGESARYMLPCGGPPSS